MGLSESRVGHVQALGLKLALNSQGFNLVCVFSPLKTAAHFINIKVSQRTQIGTLP